MCRYNWINKRLKPQLHSPINLYPRWFQAHLISSSVGIDVVSCWDPVFQEIFPKVFLFAISGHNIDWEGVMSLKRIIEATPGQSRRQSISEGTPIQRSTPHSGLNFHQSTNLCWDLQIKKILEILLETLDLRISQDLPTKPVGLEIFWDINLSVSAVGVSNFHLT